MNHMAIGGLVFGIAGFATAVFALIKCAVALENTTFLGKWKDEHKVAHEKCHFERTRIETKFDGLCADITKNRRYDKKVLFEAIDKFRGVIEKTQDNGIENDNRIIRGLRNLADQLGYKLEWKDTELAHFEAVKKETAEANPLQF